jgi:hypothetical protein
VAPLSGLVFFPLSADAAAFIPEKIDSGRWGPYVFPMLQYEGQTLRVNLALVPPVNADVRAGGGSVQGQVLRIKK